MEQLKHANEITEFTSLWKYDSYDDNWKFEAYDYQDFINRRVYYQTTSDLTGYWENGKYGAIEIVDCTVDSMYIRWEGQDEPVKFALSEDPIAGKKEGASKDPKDYGQSWYTGENGYPMYIKYNSDSTWIYIYRSVSTSNSQDLLCYVAIEDDLPNLP